MKKRLVFRLLTENATKGYETNREVPPGSPASPRVKYPGSENHSIFNSQKINK